MKLAPPAMLAVLLLAGCGSEESSPNGRPVVKEVKPPDFEAVSRILSPPDLRYEDRRVFVGQPAEDAEKLVPRPNGAANFQDLPPGFGEKFRSRGWESAGEGYGIITAEGQVVAAVHTRKGLSEAQIQDVLRKYDKQDVPPAITGRISRYWFDEFSDIRRMICAVNVKGEYTVTEAVGTSESLDSLRMNPTAARNDAKKADEPPDPQKS